MSKEIQELTPYVSLALPLTSFKWQNLGVSLLVEGLCIIPLNSPASNTGTEIPTGAEEQPAVYQDLEQRVASCPLQVLQHS